MAAVGGDVLPDCGCTGTAGVVVVAAGIVAEGLAVAVATEKTETLLGDVGAETVGRSGGAVDEKRLPTVWTTSFATVCNSNVTPAALGRKSFLCRLGRETLAVSSGTVAEKNMPGNRILSAL